MKDPIKTLKSKSWFKKNRNLIAIAAIVLLSVIVARVTPAFSVETNMLFVLSFFAAILVGVFVSYMSTLRFHSPSIAFSDGTVLSTFDANFEVIKNDLGTDWILFTSGGYLPSDSVFSARDIEFGKTNLSLVPARLVEKMGDGRYYAVRGIPLWCSEKEANALLARPAVQAALRRRGIRSASLSITFGATDLHGHGPLPHPRLDLLEQAYRDILSEFRSGKREITKAARGDIELYRLLEQKEQRPKEDNKK